MLKTVGLPGDLNLQNLNVDNININGNVISSTNTNGDIEISPNGSGKVLLGTSTPPTSAKAAIGGDIKLAKGGVANNGATVFATQTKTVTVNMGGTGSYSALISAGMNVYGGGANASALWLVNGDVANNNFTLVALSGPTNAGNCVISAATAGAGTVTFTMQNTNAVQQGRMAIAVNYAQSDGNEASVSIT
jgi:hypothetical protein